MGWGDIFSSPGIANAIGQFAFSNNPQMQNVFGGLASAYDVYSTAQKQQRSKSDYEAALRNQKAVSSAMSQEALRQMQEDSLLRSNLLNQTGELGAQLRAVYSQLGPLPSISPATIAADYGQLRAQSQNDFQNLVKLTSSQIAASNLTNLGGARNPALEDLQTRQMLEKFAPIQQQLDTAAYQEAVNRSLSVSDALIKNRQNINAAITGALNPQLAAETALYNPGRSAQAAQAAGNVTGQYLTPMADAGKVYSEELTKGLGNLTGYIADITGQKKPETINWNTGNWNIGGQQIPLPYQAANPFQTSFPMR